MQGAARSDKSFGLRSRRLRVRTLSLIDELRNEQKPMQVGALLRRFGIDTSHSLPIVTMDELRLGHEVFLDCSVIHDQFRFQFDALFRNKGRSSLGKFRLRPSGVHS